MKNEDVRTAIEANQEYFNGNNLSITKVEPLINVIDEINKTYERRKQKMMYFTKQYDEHERQRADKIREATEKLFENPFWIKK